MALTCDTWLNVEADLLAKAKTAQPHQGPQYFKLPGNPWSCYISTKCIVKQLNLSLRNRINGQEALHYWEKWKQLLPEQLQTVDWFSLGKAMQSVPLAQRRWAAKHASGHFAHGKNMLKWKFCTTAACPRCGCTTEDKPHII